MNLRVIKMYCGNNRLDERLVNGNLKLGDRYSCLAKGVGVGMNLEPYTSRYDPIYKERIYCGNKSWLPEGYDRFGSLPQCFQKGVGVGKKIVTESMRSSSISRTRSNSIDSPSSRYSSRNISPSSRYSGNRSRQSSPGSPRSVRRESLQWDNYPYNPVRNLSRNSFEDDISFKTFNEISSRNSLVDSSMSIPSANSNRSQEMYDTASSNRYNGSSAYPNSSSSSKPKRKRRKSRSKSKSKRSKTRRR